jgi:hypothetical protein
MAAASPVPALPALRLPVTSALPLVALESIFVPTEAVAAGLEADVVSAGFVLAVFAAGAFVSVAGGVDTTSATVGAGVGVGVGVGLVGAGAGVDVGVGVGLGLMGAGAGAGSAAGDVVAVL